LSFQDTLAQHTLYQQQRKIQNQHNNQTSTETDNNKEPPDSQDKTTTFSDAKLPKPQRNKHTLSDQSEGNKVEQEQDSALLQDYSVRQYQTELELQQDSGSSVSNSNTNQSNSGKNNNKWPFSYSVPIPHIHYPPPIPPSSETSTQIESHSTAGSPNNGMGGVGGMPPMLGMMSGTGSGESSIDSHINDLLMAWYFAGYQTGRFQALRETNERKIPRSK